MSSESDGGGSPRGWTLVDKDGRAEDSEDSSGSSCDFVDLEDDQVHYHTKRSGSVDVVNRGDSPTSSPASASASSLPANFRAQFGGASAQTSLTESVAQSNDDEEDGGDCDGASGELGSDGDALPPRVAGVGWMDPWSGPSTSDCHPLDRSSSSGGSTLTGSQSFLPLTTGDETPEAREVAPSDTLTDRRSSVTDEEVAGASEDCISMDSIEVLSMPPEAFRGEEVAEMTGFGEAVGGVMEESYHGIQPETNQPFVSTPGVFTESADVTPENSRDGGQSCPSYESDVSEFERIEPELSPAAEAAMPDLPDGDEEAGKMDVAGARLPDEDTPQEENPAANTFVGILDRTQDLAGGPSVNQNDLCTSQLGHPSSSPPPANGPGLLGPACPPDIPLWRHQSPANIRPFPLERLLVDGGANPHRVAAPTAAAAAAAVPGLPLSRRLVAVRHLPGHSSSDEGFELLPRRQDDDAVSSASSSGSDISGFVNVRRRRGSSFSRSLSSQPSDVEDVLDSVSNFTDLSEDCLPANMMPQSQKAGVRQYRHKRDEGLNTQLDWLVAMVLLAGLALGIGHFIGSSQELAHQNSISTGQVQRLRELQDDLVTCLDQRAGIEHQGLGSASERSSPALQAVRLLEGLGVKMKQDSLDEGRLLEQEVGSSEPGLSDSIVGPKAEDEGDQPIGIQIDIAEEGNDEMPVDGVVEPEPPSVQEPSDVGRQSADLSPFHNDLAPQVIDSGPERLTDDIIHSGVERMSGRDAGSWAATGAESKKDLVTDAGESTVSIQRGQGPDESGSHTEETYPEGEGADDDIPTDDGGVQLSVESDPIEESRDRLKSVDEEPPLSDNDNEQSTVKILQLKMELMEEKMDEMMKASRQWQEMLKESKKTQDHLEEEKGRHTEKTESGGDDADADEEGDGKETDSLAGIAAAFQSLWPDLLKTDQGKEFLRYIDDAQASFRHEDAESQGEPPSWSDSFYEKMAAFRALSETEEVQAVLNHTKLFARHLGQEVETVSEFLRNQSAKLSGEGDATAEALGERAAHAWSTLRNATADMVDFNQKVLSTMGESLADTYHSVENASAQILAKQNLSLSGVGNLAGQVWGTVKNYSAMVQDRIVNATSGSTAGEPSGFEEERSSQTSQPEGGFGESLKGAWDTVRNYSANFTSKQNLSISGLREQVKAAWGRVKNTSAQVLEDISEADLPGKLRTGAQKLGKKVDSVINTVKAKVKGMHKRKDKKRQCGKKHQCRSKLREEKQQRAEAKLQKKKQKEQQRREKEEQRLQRARDRKPKSDKRHHGRGKEQAHSKQTKGRLYSAPPRPQWVLPTKDETVTGRDEGQHSNTPLQEDSHKPESGSSIPPRQQQGARPEDTSAAQEKDRLSGNRQDVFEDETFGPKERPRKPYHGRCRLHSMGKKEDWGGMAEARWEELFDCMDMHCRGDQGCMRGQRRDAAKLYGELLDYQQWLAEQRLGGDARELDEFLEELGEFLSETDSDDGDLDELKEEFGEMVQDMEDGARKREQKQSRGRDALKTEAEPRPDTVQDLTDEENKTIIIDLKSLPKKQDPESHSPTNERRKHAGRGFHSVSGEDWYLQRARDRAEQRDVGSDGEGEPNWYLHWTQGRINSRTGVTVWDMYEWIKERYLFREELRRHEMKDHSNWFLRRP